MRGGYAFGIEEEYFLADAKTGASAAETACDRFHAEVAADFDAAEHELLKGQVEFASPPDTDPASTLASLRNARGALAGIAGAHGLSLFAAGSHPLGSFDRQETTEKERYRKLEEQFGIIAHRSMCCAMHVHVEVPENLDRVRLMNRLIPYLPLLLALSTSSPFWCGEEGGLRSTRLAIFSEWPRNGLPDLFADQAAFDAFVKRLVDAGNFENASFLWWLIRPSNKYPTIEMRICDSCTRVEEAVAIAVLYRCLVHAVARRPELNAGIGALERAIAAENIWQAQRHGTKAHFIDPAGGAVVTVAEALDAVLALVAEDADTLGSADWLTVLRVIARNGASADRQLSTFASARAGGNGTHAALRSVVAAARTRYIVVSIAQRSLGPRNAPAGGGLHIYAECRSAIAAWLALPRGIEPLFSP